MYFQKGNKNRKGGGRGKFQRSRGGRSSDHPVDNSGRIPSEKREYRHQEQLMEEDVGITEYVSKLDGYSAVIKARFSDFQVNEIDIDGNIAKLTDISEPKEFITLCHKSSYEDTKDSPLDKLPQDTWESLKNLVGNSENVPVELEADNLSKEDRTCIHECVKKYFGKEIVTSTIKKDEKTIMEFKIWSKLGEKGARKEWSTWPKNTPEFVYFIVHKQMMDTMEACFKISRALRMNPMKLTYAGVKDKRAKTTQWFCLKKYEPAKIVSNTKHIKHLTIGNFEFKDRPLKIGQLKGNRFRIALRNVLADDDMITKSVMHIKEYGFINYYGLQRFGNDKEVPTFSIGIKLLQGEWKEAVNLILKVKAADDLSLGIHKAKQIYADTGNAEEAVKLCKKHPNGLETKLLEGLAKGHPNAYVNALENIPRNVRLMYIHAYQSLIWNKMTSKRIQEFGFKPVEGDLIFTDNSQEEEPFSDTEEGDTDTVEAEKGTNKPSVRPLTANELDSYTIFDIVLPLPGYDVIYPENVKQYYKEAIEECGLLLEMPKQKVLTYNLSGTYRKIVQFARDFEWKIMYYNDPTDNLIRSDLEELNGEVEPESIENGKYKAVIVNFTLNPSSYATMALREILKCNTSSSVQAGLNNYNENNNKPKVLLETPEETATGVEETKLDEVQEGSLLADKAKYESFKNILFEDTLDNADSDGGSNKREAELEPEENEANNKKLKIDK